MSWAIVADSSCNIRSFKPTAPDTVYLVAPLKIQVGEQEFIDDGGLDVNAMNQRASQPGETSSTSCPSAGEWAELFRQADNVIAIAISSNLSGSFESALMARNMVMDEYARAHDGVIAGKNIFVLDSKAAGGKLEIIVKRLDEFLAREQPTFEEAVSFVTRLERSSNVLFSLAAYNNLVRAGRMPKIAGSLAERLSVRMLGTATEQGTIKMVGTTRSERRMVKKVCDTMAEYGYAGGMVCIDHVENEVAAEHMAEAIRARWPKARIETMRCGGLCSYYAEQSGLIIGFEWLG